MLQLVIFLANFISFSYPLRDEFLGCLVWLVNQPLYPLFNGLLAVELWQVICGWHIFFQQGLIVVFYLFFSLLDVVSQWWYFLDVVSWCWYLIHVLSDGCCHLLVRLGWGGFRCCYLKDVDMSCLVGFALD